MFLDRLLSVGGLALYLLFIYARERVGVQTQVDLCFDRWESIKDDLDILSKSVYLLGVGGQNV